MMEPTVIDVAADSSPANNSESPSSNGDADLRQEMRDYAGKLKAEESSASSPKRAAKVDKSAKPVDAASPDKPTEEIANPDEVKKEEEKSVPFETFKRRIDKITAQRHAESERADKAEMTVQRLTKAVELLRAEHQRVLPQVKIDAKDEQIRAYELEKQVAEFNSKLEQSFTEKRQALIQQQAVHEQAEAYGTAAREAAAKYGVEAKHILEIFQVSTATIPEIAQRLAATKPAAAPIKPAPLTVAAAGKTSGNSYLEDDYPTSQTMADFLNTLEK